MRALALLLGTCLACGPEPSPLMYPGEDCGGCHRHGGESSFAWTLSGTVYRGASAEPGQGLEGVEVRAIAQDGRTLVLRSNAAGNFYTREPLSFPVRIELRRGEERAVMKQLLEEPASCGSCHAGEPRRGAPGRVYLEPK